MYSKFVTCTVGMNLYKVEEQGRDENTKKAIPYQGNMAEKKD